MDKIKQQNERQIKIKNEVMKNPISRQDKKKEVKPILKNKNVQINNNNNYKPELNTNIKPTINIIPQDYQGLPANDKKIENGDKNIPKKFIKRSSNRILRKTSNSFSDKNLPVLTFNSFPKIKEGKTSGKNVVNENEKKGKPSNKNLNFLDKKIDNENGFNSKRAVAPKKKNQDIKIVPFESIEKEMILEPKILDSNEQ